MISVTKPPHLQADTLIAYHAASVTAGHIIVGASDTDLLVILIDAIGTQRPELRSMANIILDCGVANTRRSIIVSNIAEVLEECKSGCDFTSAFYS